VRNRRAILLASAMLALASSSRPARAELPLAVKLEFRADDTCPNEQDFVQRLSSRAHVRLVETAEALRLRVSLAAAGPTARGELSAGAESTTNAREVEARSCDEVADALALIAALVIERTKREQASAPKMLPPRALVHPRAVAPARTPSRRQLALGLEAIATRPMASAPLTGAGVSLFVAGDITWWLSVHYSRNDLLASARAARLGFGGLVLGAGPPALRLGSRLHLAAALAAEGAFLSAEGVDVDVKSSARRSYWAAGALGRAQYRVESHAFLFAEVASFVPLVERRFSTREPYELVSQTSRVALHAALGFAVGL
jgi:hypothetical protein